MAKQHPPVPALPSIVLALGGSLHHKLAWLERRFRTEIGSRYPGNLLRFRLVTRAEQLSPEALHTLCDPLLVHPLWLALQERGLAPGGDRGPRLCVYALLTQDDPRGCRLLAQLHGNLASLYEGHVEPDLRLFFAGTNLQALPHLEGARRPIPCFVLGPVKRFGYRTAGRQEPFETIRLALNALLASSAASEIEGLLQPGGEPGLRLFALGASAIAVARPQMETWLRNSLLQRLAAACLSEGDTGQGPRLRLQARQTVAGVFGFDKGVGSFDDPDELWEKGLGRRIAGLFPTWANEILHAWGLQVVESRRRHWRLVASAEGELYRHLQQVLSELSELQEDAQAVLAQDIVRLASGLRRHFARREQTILSRWRELPGRLLGEGPDSLSRMGAVVATAEAGLNRAVDTLEMQRTPPLWLRGDRDVLALADILAAQMTPVRSAAERARLGFVPPGRVLVRVIPFAVLLAAAGADLRPGWQGLAAGLGSGLLFAALAASLQFRQLRRGTYAGVCELCRLYEQAIGGLVLSEGRTIVRHLQEVVAISAAQLQAVEAELRALESEARQTLDGLHRFPRENTYLERQLSDAAHCTRIAGQVSAEALLAEPAAGEQDADAHSPAAVLVATLQGELPAAALGPALVEAAGGVVAQRGSGLIETRVEEMLVAGVGGRFSPQDTMDGLHDRALPLWPAEDGGDREVALVVMSREAAMAFQGWLAARGDQLRLLPTLQHDRISYLRCRPLALPTRAPSSAAEVSCTG